MHYEKYGEIDPKEKWNGFYLNYADIEGFSPLFYETNGTHWDLDNDADSFLYRVAKNYWIKDSGFPTPEVQYISSLLEHCTMIRKAREDFFNNSDFYQNEAKKPEKQQVDEFMDEVLGNGKPKKKHPDEIRFRDFVRETREFDERISNFIPTLLRAIIYDDCTYRGEITNLPKGEDTPYVRSIIRDPGKYLFSYFHDQMVFMNYVQYIVVHDRENEKNLLKRGTMLSVPKNFRDFTYKLDATMNVVSRNYRSWWT